MSYVSSENLVNEQDIQKYTHKGFRLKPCQDIGIKRSFYCCPVCKKIYKTNPFIKRNVQVPELQYECKHCHTILDIEDIHGYFALNSYFRLNGDKKNVPYLYRFTSVQTVIIGKQYDNDDGHMVAVNYTIFYQEHAIAYYYDESCQQWVQKYTNYLKKVRTIFNLDQNQIYYVKEPENDRTKAFAHFTLKNAYLLCANTDISNMNEILVRKIVQIIFNEAYRYPLVSTVKQMNALSIFQGFYLMKFPVVMSYAYFMSINDVSTRMLELFYWLSNDDRKLRPMITCRNFDEYEQLWGEYFKKTYHVNDIQTIIRKKSPWFLLTAWQLSHMGFKSLKSVERIEEYIMSTQLRNNDIPSILLLLFVKRFHGINKLFKRLIKNHGEDDVINMILQSSITGTYEYYVFYRRLDMTRKINEIQFELEDFSKPLDMFIS